MQTQTLPDGRSSILHCSLLGPPQLAWDGAPLVITRRQTRALLYLLSDDLRPTPRQRLTFLLWPDEPDAVGRRNLIRLLSYIRQTLPHPDLLLSDDTTIALNPALVESDTMRFADLCAADQVIGWESAISLYRGRFLDGFTLSASPEFDQWLSQAQHRYERIYLDLLRRLTMVRAEGGDYPAAIQYAQHYQIVDDLAEDIHRQLIVLYAVQGDRSAALHQFEQCVIVLERELGVAPLPETRSAYESARDGSAPPAPLPRPVWAMLPGLNLPLIGRAAEWQTLAAAYRRSQRGGVILIVGEAGVGKSRLMQEFATAQTSLVLSGDSQATGQTAPYQPLLQALRQALPLRDRWRHTLPIWLTELGRLLPELPAHFSDLPRPVDVPPQQAQARLFEALTQIFSALARGSPLLLCLDDVHWADEATLGWLVYMVNRLAGSGICVLVTARDLDEGRLADWRRAVQRAGLLTVVWLDGLAETAVVGLLQRAGSEPSARQPLASRIHAATGGNAFFVLETIRELLTLGELPADSVDLPLPQTVRDAVKRRLARLTPLAQQVLAMAAILSPHLRLPWMAQTIGRSELETADSLEELLAHHLLQTGDVAFRFQHDLVRQVVYEEVSPWRRRLLHQRAAEALVQRPVADRSELTAVIAYHFEAAGDTTQAVAYYRRAAVLAQRLHVHQEAIAHLQKAIALAQAHDAAADDLSTLYEELGDNLNVAGRFTPAEEAYRTALHPVSCDDRLRQAVLQYKLAATLPPQQRTDEAVALCRAALALLEERDERVYQELRLDILLGLMDALYYQLQAQMMAELEGQTRALLAEVGTPTQQVHFYSQLIQTAILRERYCLSADTVALARTTLALAQETGDAWQMAHLHFGLGFTLLWHDDLTGAERVLREAMALTTAVGNQWLQTQCLVYLTVLYRLRGDTHQMDLYLPRLAAAGQTAGSPFYQAVFQANTAWLHYRRQHLLAAQEEAQTACAAWGNSPYPFQWLAQWIVLAAALEQGTFADAITAAQAMLDPRQQRLPDPVERLLELAVQVAQAGVLEATQTHLAQAVALACEYGYL